MKHLYFLVIIILLVSGCKNEAIHDDPSGLWRAELSLNQDSMALPFFIEFIKTDSNIMAAIYNGQESIVHRDVYWRNDSLVIANPYFNSVIVAKMHRNIMNGYWADNSRPNNYRLPFTAKFNLSHRFSFNEVPGNGIDGKWQTVFSPGTGNAYPAIGLFSTDQNSTTGTFVTETGDYRFLEGGFGGNELKLSAFDGAHAFLFDAKLLNDTLRGWFYSGNHHKEPFIAWRNDSVQLQDPYTITQLASADAVVRFEGKGLDGKIVKYPSEEYDNKGVLLQVMGSWCPNCMDEAVFLGDHFSTLQADGVEVVALTFERQPFDVSVPVLTKLKKNLEIPYPILYGGTSEKEDAVKALPFLKGIESYPTLIFIKPDGSVFKIHTGFYGPGTGKYYEIQSKVMLDDFKQFKAFSK